MTTRSTRTDGREFVFLSVDIASHPKVLGMADPAAAWGYAAAVAYCGKYLTDGWITVQIIAREGGISTQKARKLVAAGLVHEHGHDCEKCPEIPKGKAYVHDYLEHNRSKAEADESRRSAQERGSAGGKKAAANRAARTTQTGQDRRSNSYSNSSSNRCSQSVPEEEEEITTHLPEARPESNTRESASAPQRAEQTPTGPATTGPNAPNAWHAVRALIPTSIPHTVRGQLAVQAQRLLDDGHDGQQVTAALTRWLQTPGAGPGLLPHIVSDLVKEQNGTLAYSVRSSRAGVTRPSTTDQRIADAMALKERLRAEGRFDNDPDPALDRPTLRALPGATA